MRIVVDSHTHTISSGHAYSTIQEIAREAAGRGIEVVAITDHGPSMIGAPCPVHFGNLRVVPEDIYGVRILKGIEANIIKFDGTIDLQENYLRRLDFVMASFHDLCIEPGSVEENTQAMISAIKNPLVDAIAHPGNPQFQVDIDMVVDAAKEFGKVLEINNHSFTVRTGSEKNCMEFAVKCKEKGVRVVCGSDAHISFDVGNFQRVKELFSKVNMPEELILSTSKDAFLKHIEGKRK
ncbi:MAG TPA: phosphatase [Pseudobacteroides sp.]|uniref:phosphatase n=1 Tax=Pseudobacteroides sp. TaxID=1968840 RepID=UPI002F941472